VSPRAAAAAVARGAASTIPAPPRTRPTRRPAPARRRSGAVAQPRTRARTVPRFDFVALLDRLLRGPAYIALVGVLLAGIVFFNVDVLELNHGIASTDMRSSQLKRDNAALTLQLAKLGSSERIQRVALQNGLVLPQPGDVRYLRAGRGDAAHALRVMTVPDSTTAATVVPAPVTQQSSAAGSAPGASAPVATTPTASTTPATTTSGSTTPASTTAPASRTPASTTPASTAPAATPAPSSTTTSAGATAAPATTAQTTP
jgi:cell division protein FtsL